MINNKICSAKRSLFKVILFHVNPHTTDSRLFLYLLLGRENTLLTSYRIKIQNTKMYVNIFDYSQIKVFDE